MASLDPLVNAELNMGAAEDFDGVMPIDLTATYGAGVGANFDDVAATIFNGMKL